MKNKILLRLIRYFVASFIIFALIIGFIFSALFRRHSVEMHKTELERQAVSIASTLSEMLEANAAGMGRGMRAGMGMTNMNLGLYLQFIEEMATGPIWVVDRDLGQISLGNRHRHRQANINFSDLPYYAEQVITEAFEGTVSTSEFFSELLEAPSITAAAPITMQDGRVIGAVLLHTYLSDVDSIISGGLTILIFSMLAAILISVFVAIILSKRFTKPLSYMKKAALKISSGDFEARTGVVQTDADEIGELAIVLDDMAEKLAAASKESQMLDKLRREFVANISHELRTPVTVIRGSLEAILDGVVTDADKTDKFHRQMLIECRYLERLVSDLLDLSRLQNTDFAIETDTVDLKDIVKDALRAMTHVAQQKNVTMAFTHSRDNLAYIGDYGRLRQMLIIVLDNAIKFSPNGGEIYIKLTKTNNITNISILDQGPGLNPNDIPHIFERFYKQRSEQNKVGTGLGLSIAKQIALRHGIAIRADNHIDGGAEFTFDIY